MESALCGHKYSLYKGPSHLEFIWNLLQLLLIQKIFAEVYSEPCQTSEMELSAKIFILDVWQGFEYTSVLRVYFFKILFAEVD